MRSPSTAPPPEPGFEAIVGLIQAARQRAFQAVNTALIDLYEAYSSALIDEGQDEPKVSALPRPLPWMHNRIILSQSKRPEEREFYLQDRAARSHR